MIVTLTTDFGTRDPYVGAMKGVLLSAGPAIAVVDLTHDVPPQDVLGAAFLLRHAACEFPPHTVHLAVVDPGVGGLRRPLAVDAGGHRWVGPDNGLLSFALSLADARAFEITHPDLIRQPLSATFHGRDLFAPTAARLALGFAVEDVGPAIGDPVRLQETVCRNDGNCLEGAVVHVDRFGNLITCIGADDLPAAESVRVRLGTTVVDGLAATYSDVDDGEFVALVGSGGWLEIGVNGGSAAERLQIRRGERVIVESAP